MFISLFSLLKKKNDLFKSVFYVKLYFNKIILNILFLNQDIILKIHQML